MGSGSGWQTPQKRALDTAIALGVWCSPTYTVMIADLSETCSLHTARPQKEQIPAAVFPHVQHCILISPSPLMGWSLLSAQQICQQ